MPHYLLIDPETGRGFGWSSTDAPFYEPGEHEVPCSEGQASDPTAWMLVNGALTPAPPLPDPLDDLAAYAATVRFAREVGGIVLGAERVKTDRESQALIAGAHALALAEPDELVDFKGQDGWVQVTSAGMILIGLAVGRHVRDCFRRESMVAAGIADGSITTRAQVDAAFAA